MRSVHHTINRSGVRVCASPRSSVSGGVKRGIVQVLAEHSPRTIGGATLDLACAASRLSFSCFCRKCPLPKAGGGWAAVLPRFDGALPPRSSPADHREVTVTVPVGVGRLACCPPGSCDGFAVSNRTLCHRHLAKACWFFLSWRTSTVGVRCAADVGSISHRCLSFSV